MFGCECVMQLIGMSSMTSFPWQAEHRAASVGEPFERQPTDYARRLPQGWMKNMLHADQLWIGKTIFASKGKLVTSLHPWYHPPALSVPKGCPKVDNYFLRRVVFRLIQQRRFARNCKALLQQVPNGAPMLEMSMGRCSCLF